ncbi:MAG: helix-turn-helix transcriptional regulator [Eubacterium sp.]|nr:helix-turn-helix transcriptional regulator [Eubacterium sp.]
MNVLDKITKLREERHWSEYQLAEKSGLTQSTISSWYRKDMLPSIPSLNKICDAFGITLSQFFLEDNDTTVSLSKKELHLLNIFSKLSKEQSDALIQFLDNL